MRKKGTVLITAILIILILFNPDTAVHGILKGIDICLKSLIPSMFPLLFFIGLVSGYISHFQSKYLSKFFKFCGIPNGIESVYILSLIGGYPLGAVTIHTLTEEGRINRQHAYRLMGFCNNAGPAFIFGVCMILFEETWVAWVVWGIQIASSCLTAAILPRLNSTNLTAIDIRTKQPISQVMHRSIKNMAMICGWVIIFRMISEFIEQFLANVFPMNLIIVIEGILELTNGCIGLNAVASEGLRFVLLSVYLSFGGLCVWLQIESAAGEFISSTFYFGKSFQVLFSALLSLFFQSFLFDSCVTKSIFIISLLLSITAILVLFIVMNSKITVAKHRTMMYNAGKTIGKEA